tara:strand:+ start:1586 stop:2494 length:909 start_codon:yes stop_codon:yes gene_type:complete
MSLKIISAEYGVGSQVIDVTSIVASRVEGDKLLTPVTNESFSNDPAPNKTKRLKLKYELDGKVIDKTYSEGVVVEIPESKNKIKGSRFSLNLPEVTLATACWGNDSFLTSAIWAYKEFKDKASFGEKVFFISENINYSEYKEFFEEESIRVEELSAKYNLARYSHFVIKDIYKYVNKDFLMLFQNDGFIDNVSSWDDRFLECDYIGAPWWYKDENNVGNGGFSIRSKKLLNILAEDDHIKEVVPEDHHICRTYGEYLRETHGIKFASEDLASKFSVEHGSYFSQFGFHGTWQLEAYIRRSTS